jgi:hypothetical protein
MADLDKAARDALPDSDFAAPRTRQLPMHDEKHTRLAWDMVDRAKGLSDTERREARTRIKTRASELGIKTEDWHITASVSFEAMALDVPDVEGHTNKMPFKGILTRVDQLSDEPPGGASGKRTYMPKTVAEAALPSLLGMAVDCTKDFDGHDRKSKIGLITGAEIVGDGVQIEGFFYAKDFPEETARIKREKEALGFSFEADARIHDMDADTWEIEYCVFTGAAVLYKDLAAYKTTSLAAKAEKDIEMTKEELQAILEASMKPLTEKIDAQGKELAELKARGASLAGPIIDQVRPHVDALNACAASMEAAGVGTDPKAGHAGVVRKIAAHLAAEAVSGKVPMIYRDHDYLPDARVEAAAQAAIAEKDKQIAELSASVKDLGTKVTDLSAKAFNEAKPAERATLPGNVLTLLAKANIAEDKLVDGKMTVEQVNTMLDASGIRGQAAIETKLKLRHAGLMPSGKAA